MKDFILENKRVRLVPLQVLHATELQEYANDNTIWTYFKGRAHFDYDLLSYINDAIDHRIGTKGISICNL